MGFLLRSCLEMYRNDVKKIMARLDSPFFFYDLDFLNSHLKSIRDLCHEDIRLWYACKANPMSAMLKICRNQGIGIDVASLGELDQALRSGIRPCEMIATGPAKSLAYMQSLLKNEVEYIVLESLNQAYWLNEAAKGLGVKPKALLRVQLAWDAGSSVLGGNAITPFGLDPKGWQELDFSRLENVEIIGHHVFQWGNILDLNKLKEIWWKIAKTVKEMSKQLNTPFEILDLGGGLGIPYEMDGDSLEFEQVANVLHQLKDEFGLAQVWMELGRYAVGESGLYFSKVIDRKSVRGSDLLVLEGGINHIARPALTQQPFPATLFRQSSARPKTFATHGPLCTSLDYLGSFELPEDIIPGDWLVFAKTGAYGLTEAMPFFLCHNLPAEVIIYNGQVMIPRTSKTSADWMT